MKWRGGGVEAACPMGGARAVQEVGREAVQGERKGQYKERGRGSARREGELKGPGRGQPREWERGSARSGREQYSVGCGGSWCRRGARVPSAGARATGPPPLQEEAESITPNPFSLAVKTEKHRDYPSSECIRTSETRFDAGFSLLRSACIWAEVACGERRAAGGHGGRDVGLSNCVTDIGRGAERPGESSRGAAPPAWVAIRSPGLRGRGRGTSWGSVE